MNPDQQPLSFWMENLVFLKVRRQEEVISREYFSYLFWLGRYYLNCKVMNFKYKVIKIYWSSKKYFLINFSIVILFTLVPFIASGCFCFKCLKTNLTRSPHNLHLAFPNILTNFSDFVIVKRYSLNQDSHPYIGCVRNSNYFATACEAQHYCFDLGVFLNHLYILA